MQADYVVVGAGSAGCAVAARLSETGASVMLLEAGPSDWHPMIHIPAGIRSLIRNPLVNWNYTTEPEKGIGRPAHRLAARANARRLELDQRHALCARQRRPTSTAGRRWAAAAGATTTCCPTS